MRIYASFLGLTELSIPTIAAVRGVAVGAGVNIAPACDVVVASPPARFALVRDMKRAVQIAGAADLAATVDFESWAQAAAVGRPAFAEFVASFTT